MSHHLTPPDPSPAHEAKESPAIERLEHKTGKEMMDEGRRSKKRGKRSARRGKR